ncbi:hypothetical protein PO909_013387 [Leuciscus waleckii]
MVRKRLVNGRHRHIPILADPLNISETSPLMSVDPSRVWFLSCPLDLCMEIGKKWKARLSWWSMAGEKSIVQPATSNFSPNTPPWQLQPVSGAFHYIQQLSIHRAGWLRGFRVHLNDLLIIHHLPVLKSTCCRNSRTKILFVIHLQLTLVIRRII